MNLKLQKKTKTNLIPNWCEVYPPATGRMFAELH